MPNAVHYDAVADSLYQKLDGHAFLTIPRTDITALLRAASGESRTRIKTKIAADIETAMQIRGLRCYPSLVGTGTGDLIRLFHDDTLMSQLLAMFTEPTPHTDKELGSVLRKIKGKWDWSKKE